VNRREFLQDIGAPLPPEPDKPAPLLDLPPLRSVPTAGSPRAYPTGTRVLVDDAQAWLCRDSAGFYAVEAHCPHLGCIVRPVADGFICPCHRSRFSTTGDREAGAAPRGLRFFYVDLDTNGYLTIDRSRNVDPCDRFMA
jgi:Rieske Fe-S protein